MNIRYMKNIRKTKKRFAVLALMVCLSLSLISFADEMTAAEAELRMQSNTDMLSQITQADMDAAISKYSDISRHWCQEYAGKLTLLDIMHGYGDGRFGPEDKLLADQFIKMTVAAMGFKPGNGSPYWAQPYIDIALEKGLVQKDEIRNYNMPLTREQMARMVVRASMHTEIDPGDKYDRYIKGRIKDYADISDSMKQHVIDAYKLGLITGTPEGTFNPGSSLTRAEAAAVIARLIDKTGRKPMAPGPDEILRIKDNKGNLIEIYPGPIREYFDVAKVLYNAIPKAKGYVNFYIDPVSGSASVHFYKDEETFKADRLDVMGFIEMDTTCDVNKYFVYNMTIYNDELYKQLFVDYIYEYLKVLCGDDYKKAAALHGKYMNMEYTRKDFLNEAERMALNNRTCAFIRWNSEKFGILSSALGIRFK